jgi:transcription antitermination factor NusG
MTALSSLDSVTPQTVDALAWFGIHVRSRCEVQAHRELTQRGFETFFPSRVVTRRWSDRTKQVTIPLFPGYLFCRFDLDHRFRILNTPGIADIVGAGHVPISIPESEIQSLQTLVSSKVVLVPWPFLKIGQRVQLERGPLAGVEGIVIQAEDGCSRVVVSVGLLQRSVATHIEREWIGKVDPVSPKPIVAQASTATSAWTWRAGQA